MVELYEKYGYFKEDLYTITLKGIDGSKQIGEMMDKLRKNPPAEFGDLKVINVRDYATGITKELATGKNPPPDFRNPMCYILISPTIHGAVQDRPEPSPRSSFTWA